MPWRESWHKADLPDTESRRSERPGYSGGDVMLGKLTVPFTQRSPLGQMLNHGDPVVWSRCRLACLVFLLSAHSFSKCIFTGSPINQYLREFCFCKAKASIIKILTYKNLHHLTKTVTYFSRKIHTNTFLEVRMIIRSLRGPFEPSLMNESLFYMIRKHPRNLVIVMIAETVRFFFLLFLSNTS